MQHALSSFLSGVQLLQLAFPSANHHKQTGSCSILQVISFLREKTEAAVGTQTNADIATEPGIKRTQADELLKMNQTRSENTLLNHFLTSIK